MDAPQDYKTAGIFMLISGGLNVMISLGLILGMFWMIVGCFWIVTLVGGVFEVIVGIAVMQGTARPNAKTISIIGLVTSLLCFNIVGLVMEVLAMTNLGKPEVTSWLALQQE